MTLPRWYAVDIGVEQMPEVSALFAQVFGQPMSDALWRWKYDAGRGVATGTRDERGNLLAHYGGTARALLVDGAALNAVQLGDVMVTEQARGILSRRGPFATAATIFLQHHVGVPGGFALGFGFPNQRHTRLGEMLGLYRALGDVQELSWTCKVAAHNAVFSASAWSSAAIDWGDARTDERLDRLWSMLSEDARGFVLPRRDAQWWRHRFANHPEGSYRCWWVRGRFSRRLLGAVALRPGKQPGDDWEILDCLGSMRHLNAILFAARGLATRGLAGRMTGWFSDALADHVRGLDVGSSASMQTACQYCVTQRWAPELPDSVVTRPWWLMGGDTDFR